MQKGSSMRWLRIALVVTAVACAVAGGSKVQAAGPAEPQPGVPAGLTVCVLDFDNNTTDPGFEVLGKGLADMVVTDLAAVPGLAVVEREKLQAVLGELALQHTRAVDPATAQKIGRLVGARYAVAGAVTAVDPVLRLDVRLIEVASAKVVLADKIVGQKDKLFELEGALLERFARALGATAAATRSGRPGQGPDFAAIMAYARGLDLADRGDADAASQALRVVVADHPGFKLAEQKYLAVLKQLYEAKAKRGGAIAESATALEASARAVVGRYAQGGLEQAPDEALRSHFAYRVILAKLPLAAIAGVVGRTNWAIPVAIPPAQRAQIIQWQDAHIREAQAFIADMRKVLGTGSVHDGNEPWIAAKDTVNEADRSRAMAAGVGDWPGIWPFASIFVVARSTASLIFLGKPSIYLEPKVNLTPSLATLEPRYIPIGLALLDEAVADLAAHPPSPANEAATETVRTLELYGDCLVAIGRGAEAVAKWQLALDRYPTAEAFPRIEAKIKQVLGLH